MHNRLSTSQEQTGLNEKAWYDYTNQAWVENGKYVRCGHPDCHHCRCYGRLHAGEMASRKN